MSTSPKASSKAARVQAPGGSTSTSSLASFNGKLLVVTAILVLVIALSFQGLVMRLTGVQSGFRCGGPHVELPYCDACSPSPESACCLVHYAGGTTAREPCSWYRNLLLSIVPTLGADGQPFILDLDESAKQFLNDSSSEGYQWAGEAKVDWDPALVKEKTLRIVQPGNHAQAVCYYFGDGSIFDVTYNCFIVRW